MMLRKSLVLAGALAVTLFLNAAQLSAGAQTASLCADTERLSVPDVKITSATPVAQGELYSIGNRATATAAKPFCRVAGVIEKEIGFELWLPLKSEWNGNFLAVGVGGQAGSINTSDLARIVNRGYASASTDAGHKASDTQWLLGDPMRAENYAHRANHLLAVKSKQIIEAVYGNKPRKSYFLGCSGGGRQALTEVQRYPQDFDGVIAGAPGVNTPEMSARRLWEMLQHTASAGRIAAEQWDLVAQAAVRACDADDGLTDGIVTNPATCGFKVASLTCASGQTQNCLTPEQVQIVQRIYAPLYDEKGKKIDGGVLPGVPISPVMAPEPFTPGPAYLAVVLFAHGVHHDANWDPRNFRIADDLPAADKVMNLHADDPRIAAFRDNGGKLILYQGWADPLVLAQSTVDYYDALGRELGGESKVRNFVRLFMVPGMGHCRGGDVPDCFGGLGAEPPVVDPDHDLLSALERWTDTGVAPERVIASKLKDGRVIQTRPLCAHPAVAQYRGSGDPNDFNSFTCRYSGAGAPVQGASAAFETTLGKLPDGTDYRIDLPRKWNGTVLIGLDYAGRADPLAEGEATAGNRKLVEQGYAMAGTTRNVTGWAIHLAAANAIRTLDIFETKYGKAKHAIEFGGSQGGHTAAVSVQAYPQRWDGAVVQCGGLSGTVGQWQSKFDALFVAKTLLAPESSLPIINIPKDFETTALPAWRQMLASAQQTPQGQARIALASMLGELPDWANPGKPRPLPDDLGARQDGLIESFVTARLPLLNQALSSRSQIEALAGGNITSNVGVDYAKALREIDTEGLIAKLYQKAGLSLTDDLGKLAEAPRISASPAALAYVATGVFDGNLNMPVLTISNIGDPISSVAAQQFYGAAVKAAGKQALLRQVYTAGAGHCGFTPAESVAAVQTLVHRLDSGQWDSTSADAMNREAAQTGLGPSRFIDYTPARFVRTYTACDLERDLSGAGVAPVRAEGQALPVCKK